MITASDTNNIDYGFVTTGRNADYSERYWLQWILWALADYSECQKGGKCHFSAKSDTATRDVLITVNMMT